jgi:hypothetical protein
VINLRQTEPWRELPVRVADVIEPEIPATTRDILEAIGREVPEYARPIEGRFGRGLRAGVDEALAQFVSLVRDPDAGRDQGRGVYIGLGRGELRQGRTLDSLQSAYRVGARVAWRHLAAAGRQAGLDADVLNTLAEAIFAYIDELSADSVEGYAEAQSELAGLHQRRRRELVGLVLRDPRRDGTSRPRLRRSPATSQTSRRSLRGCPAMPSQPRLRASAARSSRAQAPLAQTRSSTKRSATSTRRSAPPAISPVSAAPSRSPTPRCGPERREGWPAAD